MVDVDTSGRAVVDIGHRYILYLQDGSGDGVGRGGGRFKE